ncbi:hypothetical protein QN277_011789 [Acacia crassicarpa]|uniref:Late embryogenesis abundant protein n=1 Tax=Acacia crassicarpa TaxID=499986 RepID=A0AAE1MZJ0_9FABA|nr:hypothetical protein QN277_011789 [Acacia crassicarpa]
MNRSAKLSIFNVIHRYPSRHNPKPTSSSPHTPSAILSISSSHRPSFPEPSIPTKATPNFHSFSIIPLSYFMTQQYYLRSYNSGSGSSGSEVDKDKEVDMINLKFAEAREEIEEALDSKDTVYFNEEAECARAAVTEVLEMFEGLLAKLPESEKTAIQRSMGLKIEQLKAELKQLDE